MSWAFSAFRLTCGWLKAVAEHARMTVPLTFACVTAHGGVVRLPVASTSPGLISLLRSAMTSLWTAAES